MRRVGQYKRKVNKGIRWLYKGSYLGIRYGSGAIYLSKQEAKKAERAKIDELDRKKRNSSTDISLIDLMDARLDELKIKKSKIYYNENKRYFKRALAFWKDQPASEITKKDANDFLLAEAKRLKREHKQNYAVNACIRVLKALFNLGISDYGLEKNPFHSITKFSIDVKLKYIPADQEFYAVREIINEQQKFLFDFVDQTACRIFEAIRFKAEDIQGDFIILWTRKSKNSNLTPRRIPKPDCLKDYQGKGKVFHWTDHPPFLEVAIRRLNLPKWNWHTLRHRRASIWANSNMPLIEIMQRLGHSNLQTTQKYLQLLGFSGKNGERI